MTRIDGTYVQGGLSSPEKKDCKKNAGEKSCDTIFHPTDTIVVKKLEPLKTDTIITTPIRTDTIFINNNEQNADKNKNQKFNIVDNLLKFFKPDDLDN